MNSVAKQEEYNSSTILDENFTSTLNTTSNDDNFIEIITNPYFYGSSIIFIILIHV